MCYSCGHIKIIGWRNFEVYNNNVNKNLIYKPKEPKLININEFKEYLVSK